MTSLFIERSTERTTAAVEDGGAVEEAVLEAGGGWVDALGALLRGRKPDRIVVGTGPGSFAGVRGALAFAMGWELGSQCEVTGLPSPCACACATKGDFAVVGDARRGKFWVALFSGGRAAGDVSLADSETLFSSVPEGFRVVTVDESRIGEALAGVFKERYAGGEVPSASGLARYASANPGELRVHPLPTYMSPAVRNDGEGGR